MDFNRLGLGVKRGRQIDVNGAVLETIEDMEGWAAKKRKSFLNEIGYIR